MNAGAAIYAAEAAQTLEEGVALAKKVLASGAGMAKLEGLRAITNS